MQFLSSISGRPPLLDEIAKRFISDVERCLSCDSEMIKFVTSYGITFGRMPSPICSAVANLAFTLLGRINLLIAAS